MFPELRAVQIEVPRDVLAMLEGSGEPPAHEAGDSDPEPVSRPLNCCFDCRKCFYVGENEANWPGEKITGRSEGWRRT
jgi:hypothetical protein